MTTKYALPKVDFQSITLSGGTRLVKKTDEPHILEGSKGFNMVQEAIAPESEPMIVDLLISIKTPNIFEEFFKANILDYVGIRVMQSTNSIATRVFKNNPETLIDLNNLIESSPQFEGYVERVLKGEALNELEDELGLHFEDIYLADYLGTLPENSPDYASSVEVEYDSNGFKTYNYTYSLQFEVSQKEGGVDVRNLAYFSYAYIDLSKISVNESPFNPPTNDGITAIGQSSILNSFRKGTSTSQIVITSGKVNNFKQIFWKTPTNSSGIPIQFPLKTDQNGNIIGVNYNTQVWTGPVHYHGPGNPNVIRDDAGKPIGQYIGYMAGYPGQDMGPYLTPAPAVNGIIRDLRVINKFDSTQISGQVAIDTTLNHITMQKVMDSLEKSGGINNNLEENPYYNEAQFGSTADFKLAMIKYISGSKHKAYFTDPYHARDGFGNYKFMFGMNYLEILKENSSFPKLIESVLRVTSGYDPESKRRDFLKQVIITNFSVYRHEVSPSNPADPTVDLYENVKNSDAVLVASSKHNSSGFVKTGEKKLPFSGGEVIGSIAEFNPESGQRGRNFYRSDLESAYPQFEDFRFFTVIDKDIPNDGHYIYSVEIEFKDPIIDWVQQRVGEMDTIIADCESYIESVTQNPLHYNLNTNRFTKKGKDYIEENWNSITPTSFKSIDGTNKTVASGINYGGYLTLRLVDLYAQFVNFKEVSIPKMWEWEYTLDGKQIVGAKLTTGSDSSLSAANTEANNTKEFYLNELGMNLALLIDGMFANPNTMNIFLSVAKKMQSEILKVFSSASKYKKPIDSQHVESQYAAGSNPSRSYKIQHKFNYKLDASTNYKTGYDYLSELNTIDEENPGGTSLKFLYSIDYESRCDKEVKKLFPVPPTSNEMKIFSNPTLGQDAPGNTLLNAGDNTDHMKFCYFSPSVINVEGQSHNMLNDGIIRTGVKFLNNIMLNIIRHNLKQGQNLDFPKGIDVATGVGLDDGSLGAIQGTNFGGPGGNNEGKFDLLTMLSGRQSSVLISKNLIEGAESKKSKDESYSFSLKDFENLSISDNIINSNINPIRTLLSIMQSKYFNFLSDPIWTWDYYIQNAEDIFYKDYLQYVENNLTFSPLKICPNHVKALMIDMNWGNNYENVNLEALKYYLKQNKKNTYEYDLPEDVANASNLFGILPKTQESSQRIEKSKVYYQTPEFLPFYMLNYKKVSKIEVLVGYDVDATGRMNLNAPVWQLLTRDLYMELAVKGLEYDERPGEEPVLNTSNTPIYLCRIRPYENEKYGIKNYDILNLPVYNEHFLVRFTADDANKYAEIVAIKEAVINDPLDPNQPLTSADTNLDDELIPEMTQQITIGIDPEEVKGLVEQSVEQQEMSGLVTALVEAQYMAQQAEAAEAIQEAREDTEDTQGTATTDREPSKDNAEKKGFVIINLGANGSDGNGFLGVEGAGGSKLTGEGLRIIGGDPFVGGDAGGVDVGTGSNFFNNFSTFLQQLAGTDPEGLSTTDTRTTTGVNTKSTGMAGSQQNFMGIDEQLAGEGGDSVPLFIPKIY